MVKFWFLKVVVILLFKMVVMCVVFCGSWKNNIIDKENVSVKSKLKINLDMDVFLLLIVDKIKIIFISVGKLNVNKFNRLKFILWFKNLLIWKVLLLNVVVILVMIVFLLLFWSMFKNILLKISSVRNSIIIGRKFCNFFVIVMIFFFIIII